MNTIQDNLIREFDITGTAIAPKTPIESLYLLQKKKQKKKQTMDDVHPQVEVYLKSKYSQRLTSIRNEGDDIGCFNLWCQS